MFNPKPLTSSVTPSLNSKDRYDSFKQIIRGGQVFLHNFRMIGQVLNKVMLWTLPIGLLVSVVWFVGTTHTYDRYLGIQWMKAEVNALIWDEAHLQPIIDPRGNLIDGSAAQIMTSPAVNSAVARLSARGEKSLEAGLIFYILTCGLVLWWLKRQGEENSKAKYIKGDYLSPVKEVENLLKAKNWLSDRRLGETRLPLPAFSEMQHYLFHGTTGSGKSTAIKECLDFIRRKGERAIIYCKGGSFVKQFLREEDILLNPLDERGRNWNLWGECRDKTDFENLAAALIPLAASGQDPFWNNAARTIFAVSAYRMHKQKEEAHKNSDAQHSPSQNKTAFPEILTLLRYLLTADIQELQDLLKGTEAETLMSEKTEKTAISIKSILATYLKSLCYIKDGENPFSIRRWIAEADHLLNPPWLFISSLGDKHESLKPLITAWLDIAVNALLSLPENPHRRIWVVLDELTSLQQLPYLSAALSESRKFGGCMVIGIQSYAQLAKLYGFEGAREISSLLNTRLMFRIPDPEIAAWTSKNLGEITVEEAREGISYGANTMRDGVSVNRVEKERPLVSASEIMRMPDLSCYVRLPGEYPIVPLTFAYIDRPAENAAFVARPFEMKDFRETLALVEQCQESKPPPTSSPNPREAVNPETESTDNNKVSPSAAASTTKPDKPSAGTMPNAQKKSIEKGDKKLQQEEKIEKEPSQQNATVMLDDGSETLFNSE